MRKCWLVTHCNKRVWAVPFAILCIFGLGVLWNNGFDISDNLREIMCSLIAQLLSSITMSREIFAHRNIFDKIALRIGSDYVFELLWIWDLNTLLSMLLEVITINIDLLWAEGIEFEEGKIEKVCVSVGQMGKEKEEGCTRKVFHGPIIWPILHVIAING